MTKSETYNLAVCGAYWIIMSTTFGLGHAYLMGWFGPYTMHPMDWVVFGVGILMLALPIIQFIRGDERLIEWLLFKRETPN